MRHSSLVVATFLANSASAIPLDQRSPKDTYFSIANVGTFAKRQTWNFSRLPDGSDLPDGLYASSYNAEGTHVFVPENVYISGGYLNLKVNGGKKMSMPYKSAEVVTEEENMKFASVRVVGILSEPAGVCNGMFFYQSDQQESDIEWISSSASQSNNGKRWLWFSNQAASTNVVKSVKAATPPSKPTSTEHEYRLDWLPYVCRFYIDGVLIWESRKNVPNQPGPWVFNNWSDGDPTWTAGPPKTDAFFKIRSIDMYYNVA